MPASLAKVAIRISEYEGLIGDVTTIAVARNESLRDITVELRDKEHAEALAAGLGELARRDRGLVSRPRVHRP